MSLDTSRPAFWTNCAISSACSLGVREQKHRCYLDRGRPHIPSLGDLNHIRERIFQLMDHVRNAVPWKAIVLVFPSGEPPSILHSASGSKSRTLVCRSPAILIVHFPFIRFDFLIWSSPFEDHSDVTRQLVVDIRCARAGSRLRIVRMCVFHSLNVISLTDFNSR